MKQYRKKIENRNFNSRDVESLITDIKLIIKEKKQGYTELSDDDVKQLKVIKFFLGKYEENNSNVSLGTQDEHLSHYKVRNIINELELNNIVTQVIQITDRIQYRNYLYKLVEETIDKIPRTEFNFFKKINWHDPWIVTIGGTIIASLILLFLAFMFSWPPFTPEEPPRIEIESASFEPTYFGCNNNHEFDIKYKVAHIGGVGVGFGQPYYIYVNQTKNTCLEDFTFFNSTQVAHPLCYNTFYKGNDEVEACNPKFEPINKETVLVVSHQNSLSYRMTKIFEENNVSTCEISEQVKLCVDLDGTGYCSQPKDVDINFNCNRK